MFVSTPHVREPYCIDRSQMVRCGWVTDHTPVSTRFQESLNKEILFPTSLDNTSGAVYNVFIIHNERIEKTWRGSCAMAYIEKCVRDR